MARGSTGSIGDIQLSTSDIQIGAVEIKDGDSDVRADVRDLSNSDALNVAIVDASGDQITSFGGGTQYTEDDVSAANPVGTSPALVADSAPGLEVAEGDVVIQRATRYGAGYVQVVDSTGNFVDSFGGSGGTAAADDADFTAGTTQGTPAMGVYESSPTSVTDGDLGIVGISADRRLLTDTEITVALPTGDNNIGNVDIASSVALDVSAATVPVDLGANNDVTINGSSVVFVDDTATHTATTTEVVGIGAVATPTDGSVDANDIAMPAMSLDRRLHVDADITTQSLANLQVQSNSANIATETTVAAIQTAVEIMDDWDETNRAAVNLISGQAGVAGGSGTVGATTQRVVLATDVALPAGTNAIGKLAANNGVDIGDVDVTSISNANFAAAEDAALPAESVLIAGDDGTDTKNINVDATTGDVQVDVTNTVTVDLGANNDVVQTTHDNFNANANIQVGNSDVSDSNPVPAAPTADASVTGTSTFYDNDLDETKIEVTDNPNVRIYSIHAINTTAAPLYLQMFDLDSDNVTVGTTGPTNQYIIPGNADSDGAGFTLSFSVPKTYSTGFTVACTTNSEGSGAPGANACHVNIEYISAA